MFGSLLTDFEDDPIFGHHMSSMRQMNRMMNGLMGGGPLSIMDMCGGGIDNNIFSGMRNNRNTTSLMPFGFPPMPNLNPLLNNDLSELNGVGNGGSYCSSSFMSMTQGPDGRPQVYHATSSSKTGPGGIRETRKTVQDSKSGLKKMAIGHHIGERAHIIEREQNLNSGSQEERQDFINLDETEAEEFDHEFSTKARTNLSRYGQEPRRNLPALPAPPGATSSNSSIRRGVRNVPTTSLPRRQIRTPSSSPLALPSPPIANSINSSTVKSVHPHPYNSSVARRNARPKKMSKYME